MQHSNLASQKTWDERKEINLQGEGQKESSGKCRDGKIHHKI